jgi:hypothetical protein
VITDGKMKVLLREGVLRTTKEAAHPKSVVPATVKIHEIPGTKRVEDSRIVLGVGGELSNGSFQVQMFSASQKCLQTRAQATQEFRVELKESVEIGCSSDIFGQSHRLEPMVTPQNVQAYGVVVQTHGEMALGGAEPHDTVGEMLKGKGVLYKIHL